MEVPGRKIELLCEPCGENGQKLLAVGFCVDCSEFLCRECYKHHCTPKPSRNHVLQDEESMPKTKPDSMPPNITGNENKCQKHTGETIKFYCRPDRKFGCGSCMTLDHYACDKPIYIEEEYKNFEAKLHELEEQLKYNSEKREQNSTANKSNHSEVVKDIKKFMTEVKEYFQKLETAMSAEADKLQDDNEKKMNVISATCMTLGNDLQTLTADLSNLHQTQQNEKLFTMMEEAKDRIETKAKKINQMKKENTVQSYSLVPEKQIQDMINKVSVMGKLVTKDQQNDDHQIVILDTPEENTLTSDKAMASKSKTQTGAHQKQSRKTNSQVTPTVVRQEETSRNENTQATGIKTPTAEENSRREGADAKTSPSISEKQPTISDKYTKTQDNSSFPERFTRDAAGSIQQFPFKVRNLSLVSTIDGNSGEDTYELLVTGLDLLPDDHLILADKNNLKVKLINTKRNRIITELYLASVPHDITVVNDNQVAMTMPDANQIQLMSISNQQICLGQIIEVKGHCFGIVYNDGNLLVTFVKPAKVELISMSGDVLRVIDKPLFEKPFYLALSPDKTHVYISDMGKHTVTCMTLDGEVKGEYEDKRLKRPLGLTVDKTGNVYSKIGGVYSIPYMHMISGDCSQCLDILTRDWRNEGGCITYCHKEDKIYALDDRSQINVFQLN